MVSIGRHAAKLSDCAPTLQPSFDAATIMAQQTKLPPRPDAGILSEAIPLFFIGRNEDGFWVAREADGRIGGIFLRKQSALRFANRNTQPGGCATMFLTERFELDIANKGNPLVAHLAAARRVVLQLAQRAAPQAAAIAKRAHPAALLLGLFATAFTATIVMRLAVWLAVIAAKSAF
jgi:hypothetical protein